MKLIYVAGATVLSLMGEIVGASEIIKVGEDARNHPVVTFKLLVGFLLSTNAVFFIKVILFSPLLFTILIVIIEFIIMIRTLLFFFFPFLSNHLHIF